jgi:hypothetical protein
MRPAAHARTWGLHGSAWSHEKLNRGRGIAEALLLHAPPLRTREAYCAFAATVLDVAVASLRASWSTRLAAGIHCNRS